MVRCCEDDLCENGLRVPLWRRDVEIHEDGAVVKEEFDRQSAFVQLWSWGRNPHRAELLK